ncbi:hypothetical protein SSS_04687 [Sarcoptes scabiei]|nr:hypothetical protein SSS_04687 [Sarcoptes scabiei]
MRYEFQKKQPLPKFPQRIQLIPFDEIEKIGSLNKSNGRASTTFSSDPNAISMIMYTSGTTGTPKAVKFSNKQIISCLISLASNVDDIQHEGPRHRYASFLPLAHIMGFTFELFFFIGGLTIGYSSPNTLTDSSPGNVEGQAGDLRILKPTVLVSVPLILDRIVKEIYLKLQSRSPILPPLFNYLIDYKIRWTERGFTTPILNRIICRRVQEQFGGNLEFIICGGAPLNPKTERIIRAALNVKLMTGYGLTETTGGVIGMRREHIISGVAGIPLEGVNVRLIDWKEGGYTIDDKPHPRGEIVIGGENIAEGYYELEEETKEVFHYDSHGTKWFHTGDIGEILDNGSLKIIDRKKDLAKLPNGEYISFGKIEGTLKTASLIENCCICIDSHKNDIIALIVPNTKHLKLLANKYNKSDLSHSQLCHDKTINEKIMQEINDICKKSKFHRREIPKSLYVCDEEWTPDNDLLTSAFKLKRKNVYKHYEREISQLFANLS